MAETEECIKEFAREIMQGIVKRGMNSILGEMGAMSIDSKKFHIGIIITPKIENDALDCSTIAANNFGLDCVSGNTILNLHTLGTSVGDGSIKDRLVGLRDGLDEIETVIAVALEMAEASLSDIINQPPPSEAN